MSEDFDLLSALNSLDNDTADNEIREDYVRAPFGYPGSKAKAIKNIVPHLPYTDMYCEPFGGTGSVWLARNAVKLEIFNDRYSGVTSFYRVLRDKPLKEKLEERLQFLIHSREEFIWSRSTWKNCDDLVERAARWYYTVRNSFGSQSLYFGRSKNPKAVFASKLQNGLELFHPIHERIKNSQIENLDWRVCFNDYNRPECVWYLDPPYYQATKGMYECEFTDSEHIELLDRIQDLLGFVAISTYPNELYEKYDWDKRVIWEQGTSTLGIAFTGSNKCAGYEEVLSRKKAMEVLYIRYAK
jgi:DNA adenine methylase